MPLSVVNSFKALSRTNRPVYRTGGNPQLLFNFIKQLKGVVCIPVHLIDKGKNRNFTHNTNLEQLTGLSLHTLGRINHHHGGIRRHQRTVGVLRKVLVPRRVQNIDAEPAIFKLQHGRSD